MDMVKFKVMWYNIMRGFHKKENDGSLTFQPERLSAVKKIILKENPDIIFLGEADFGLFSTFIGPKTNKIDYQKIFNYPHFFQFEITTRKGEVILSKIPFKAESFSTEAFSYTKTKFNFFEKKVEIDMVHPYPTIPEKEKANKIMTILKNLHSPYILLGDFNALSKRDNYNVDDIAEGFRPARGKWAKDNAIDALQGLMIKEIEASGLIDTYRVINKNRGYTFPTKNFCPAKDYKSSMRLDYIFCSKDFKIIDSKCIKNKLTEKASDHYPVMVTLEI